MLTLIVYLICWYNTGLLTCASLAQWDANKGADPVSHVAFFLMSTAGPLMTIFSIVMISDEINSTINLKKKKEDR